MDRTYHSGNSSQGIMKKKISEIVEGYYGVGNISCEPTLEDIQKDIREGNLEERSFQRDEKELNDEWNRKAINEDHYYALQKGYHSQRIAYFMVHGWNDPIVLNMDGCTIEGGLHRFKAAKYRNMEVIDVIVNVKRRMQRRAISNEPCWHC